MDDLSFYGLNGLIKRMAPTKSKLDVQVFDTSIATRCDTCRRKLAPGHTVVAIKGVVFCVGCSFAQVEKLG